MYEDDTLFSKALSALDREFGQRRKQKPRVSSKGTNLHMKKFLRKEKINLKVAAFRILFLSKKDGNLVMENYTLLFYTEIHSSSQVASS